jgi:hypothetical protein
MIYRMAMKLLRTHYNGLRRELFKAILRERDR